MSTTTVTTAMGVVGAAGGPVGVDELKRAWAAVRSGEFRAGGLSTPRAGQSGVSSFGGWNPEPWERPLPVLGCAGSVGATTVALAMGLAARGPVRVVECGSATATGLAAASTAELGRHVDGWVQGRRDHVLLERGGEVLSGPGVVPRPLPADALAADEQTDHGSLTILDAGWEAGQLLASGSWLVEMIRTAPDLVLVTRATVPGIRRLDGVVSLLDGAGRVGGVTVAVLGPRRKKWPRGLLAAGGPRTRPLLEAPRVVEIPDITALASWGLDSRPLPAPVLEAASRLLPTVHQPPTTQPRRKGDEQR